MARKTKAEAEQTRLKIIDAARQVFHECGVRGTTLEKVAEAAGVTRGAIYWHFENKTALFFAMRDQASQLLDSARMMLLSNEFNDPLDALERSMLLFFDVVQNTPSVKQTFEVMSLRCEYVDEFAGVLAEANQPCVGFLNTLKDIYTKAEGTGLLRPGFDPEMLAYDTLSFTTGLFKNLLSGMEGNDCSVRVSDMIHNHVALRRRVGAVGG